MSPATDPQQCAHCSAPRTGGDEPDPVAAIRAMGECSPHGRG